MPEQHTIDDIFPTEIFDSFFSLVSAFIEVAIALIVYEQQIRDEISNNPFVRFGKPALQAKATKQNQIYKRQIQLQRFQPREFYKRFPVISRYSE